ncbi:MAG: choice-of-anchor R domain-containing protein [Tepidisphaeraceae bacterium]
MTLGLALTLCAAWIAPASAAVVYNNLGPGDTFNTGSSYDITSQPANNNLDLDRAMPFTVPGGATYQLDAIRLAASNPLNNPGEQRLDISVRLDAAGSPGAILESFAVDLPPPLFTGVVSAKSTTNPLLLAGTQYWVVASAGFPNSWLGWHLNDQGATGTLRTQTNNSGVWSPSFSTTLGAFHVEGIAIPEPSGLLPLCAAALGLFVLRRK